MHKAVFEDVFLHQADALGLRGQRHILRLHVGREAGILFGRNVDGAQRAIAAHAESVRAECFDARSGLFKLGDDRAEMPRIAIVHNQVAAGDSAGDKERAGLDAVGIDAMPRAMQAGDALHAHGGCARAFNLRAHGYQQLGQVGDFGLARAILHHGFAVGKHGGHQQVFGAGHGDLVKDNMRALQPCHARFKVAVLLQDGCAHLFQALDVQIDGSAADGASARHGHTRHSRARNQRTKHQRAGAHGLHNFVLGFGVGENLAADLGAVLRAAVAQLHLGAHGGQQAALGFNVAHLRNVFQRDFVLGKDGRGHAGKCRVLRARNANSADQRIAAANDEFIHEAYSTPELPV